MHKLIRDFLDRFSASSDATAPDERDLRIAAALLMVEIGQADNEWRKAEIETIVARLARLFDLDEAEARALFGEARREDEARVSLHPTIQVINRHFTPEQKQQILTDCWRVAFADGELDHYEEHQIRRIADLLYLPHSRFIQAKHRAQQEMARSIRSNY